MYARLKEKKLLTSILSLMLALFMSGTAFSDSGVRIDGDVTQGDNSIIAGRDVIIYQQLNDEYVRALVKDVLGLDDESVTIKAVNVRQELRGWNGSSYQYVLFGKYDQQDGYEEPILWRVLYSDNNKALLLSEYVLDTRAFDSQAPVWDGSDIKAWLNGSFYESAFTTSAQRNCLITGGNGTVFLLGKEDYLNTAYGFSAKADANDGNRSARGSAYARNHGLWTSESQYCSYYTRTSSGNGTSLWQIRSSGSIGIARYDRDNVGIRPAIWIDLDKIQFNFGEGTMELPFQEAQPSSSIIYY